MRAEVAGTSFASWCNHPGEWLIREDCMQTATTITADNSIQAANTMKMMIQVVIAHPFSQPLLRLAESGQPSGPILSIPMRSVRITIYRDSVPP